MKKKVEFTFFSLVSCIPNNRGRGEGRAIKLHCSLAYWYGIFPTSIKIEIRLKIKEWCLCTIGV